MPFPHNNRLPALASFLQTQLKFGAALANFFAFNDDPAHSISRAAARLGVTEATLRSFLGGNAPEDLTLRDLSAIAEACGCVVEFSFSITAAHGEAAGALAQDMAA